jgi:hypothetical protein
MDDEGVADGTRGLTSEGLEHAGRIDGHMPTRIAHNVEDLFRFDRYRPPHFQSISHAFILPE